MKLKIYQNRNVAGFTLAEVLITLGIIGIISAMTIPTLIQNNRNRELAAGLQTAYSEIQQGLNLMSADKGNTVTPSDYNNRTIQGTFYKDYKNYFKKIYDCGTDNPDTTICMARASNTSDENNYNNDLTYKTYTGRTLYTNPFDDGQFVLANGMLILIENPQQIEGVRYPIFISVDINGKRKKPNKLGHDLFTFQLMDNGKLLPMGANGTKYPESEYCKKISTSNINGIGCTNKALTDKEYFKNLPK